MIASFIEKPLITTFKVNNILKKQPYICFKPEKLQLFRKNKINGFFVHSIY